MLDGEHHLEQGVVVRLAGLGRDHPCQVVAVRGDRLLELEQPVATAAEALGVPPARRAARPLDGCSDVGGGGDRVFGKRLPRPRIQAREGRRRVLRGGFDG